MKAASLSVLVLFAVLGAVAGAAAWQESAGATILVGRLATVEPANRRITLVVDGEESLTAVHVHEEAVVRDGEEGISLAQLVTLVGSRVTLSYEMQDGVRVTRSLIVEESVRAPSAATGPILLL
jgi:hypothetical protein